MCFAGEKQEEAKGEGGREARKMDENQGTGKRKAATDCRLAVSVSVNERHTESGK